MTIHVPGSAPTGAEHSPDLYAPPEGWGGWDMSDLTPEERQVELEKMSAWMEEAAPGYKDGDGILVWSALAKKPALLSGPAQRALDRAIAAEQEKTVQLQSRTFFPKILRNLRSRG